MKNILFIFLYFFCLQIADAKLLTCKVVAVSDGDTFTCLTKEKNRYKVRLEGIDAPEKSQPFGTKSKEKLSDLIFKKDVQIKYENFDKFGRVLGHIYSDMKCINLVMVQSGHAWVFKKFNKDPHLVEAESIAKEKGIGIWSEKDPIYPSDYRKLKRKF